MIGIWNGMTRNHKILIHVVLETQLPQKTVAKQELTRKKNISHYGQWPWAIRTGEWTTTGTSKSTVILCTKCRGPSPWMTPSGGGWAREASNVMLGNVKKISESIQPITGNVTKGTPDPVFLSMAGQGLIQWEKTLCKYHSTTMLQCRVCIG